MQERLEKVPALSPLTPGFATGRFVGFVSPIIPQFVGEL